MTLAGGTIFQPSSFTTVLARLDAVDQFLFRVMTLLGLKPARAFQWKGSNFE
jgi:hypothetical protein